MHIDPPFTRDELYLLVIAFFGCGLIGSLLGAAS